MRACVVCIVLAGAVTGGCSSGESYVKAGFNFARADKVGVVDVQGDIKGETARNQISDLFETELIEKGYSPIGRARVQTLLKEQRFQAPDITTAVDAARAGQIVDVPAVLMVDIPNFGEETSITAKMIDAETGGVLWMASGTGHIGGTLSRIFGRDKARAAGSGEYDESAGGAADRALSPQKAAQARKIIEKMCKGLPARGQRK